MSFDVVRSMSSLSDEKCADDVCGGDILILKVRKRKFNEISGFRLGCRFTVKGLLQINLLFVFEVVFDEENVAIQSLFSMEE